MNTGSKIRSSFVITKLTLLISANGLINYTFLDLGLRYMSFMFPYLEQVIIYYMISYLEVSVETENAGGINHCWWIAMDDLYFTLH